MTKRDPWARLKHMRDYSQKAISLVEGKSQEDIEENEVLSLALTRLVELIGEAASQIPREEQEKFPTIPWPQIISMRNRLIHAYDEIDYDILWEAITKNLPQLISELKKIVPLEK